MPSTGANSTENEVSTYSSATDALKVLREGKEPVDIVLSDVHMPDMDGFKLLEAVGLDLNIPVISTCTVCLTLLARPVDMRASAVCAFCLSPATHTKLRLE